MEVLRRRFGTLMLISAVTGIPAGWLYGLAREEVEGVVSLYSLLIDLGGPLILCGGLLIQCVGAAICMGVAWGYLTGVKSSGPVLARWFSKQLGRVVGTVLLVELVLLLVGWVGGSSLGLMPLGIVGFPILEIVLPLGIPGIFLNMAIVTVAGVWGMILMVRWLLFLPVLVTEDVGVYESLRRSWKLVKGRSWWTFGMGILMPAFLILVPFLALFWIPGLGGIFTRLVVVPFAAVWNLNIYLDLRYQREGFTY